MAPGVLRVHFTAEDLARTRIAPEPDVMWEITLSLTKLQSRHLSITYEPWRRAVIPRVGPWMDILRVLTPPTSYFADFLTPSQGTQGLEAGIDAVLSTPVRQLRAEMGQLAVQRPLPSWTGGLADGELAVMKYLGRALHTYHRIALGPYWRRIRGAVTTTRTQGQETLANDGLGELLSTLHPALRWRFPVLEADYPLDRDLHLGGRGITLIPSFFCSRMPVTLADGDLTPVLVYPAVRGLPFPDADELVSPPDPAASVGALLGIPEPPS